MLVDILSQSKKKSDYKKLLDLVDANDKANNTALRTSWSKYFQWVLFFMILFQCALVTEIGLGVLNYEKYQTFLHAVVIENFLQMLGAGLIIVRYLFKEEKKSTEK